MLLKVYKSRVWLVLFMLLPFVGFAQIPDLPAGWEFTENPNSAVYAIPVDVVQEDVGPLEAGDWIGAFFMDAGVMKCGGAVQWDGTGNVAIVINPNDTLEPNKNGFSEGEAISWKFNLAGVDGDVKAYDADGNEFTFAMNDLQTVAKFGPDAVCMTIELSTGFQFISSYVAAPDPDMQAIMTDVLDYMEFTRSSTGAQLEFFFGSWFNGIGDWVNTEGYLVKMTGDATVEICGSPVDPQSPIGLTEGFQFVGYLDETPQDAYVAFEGVLDNLEFVRASNGSQLEFFFGSWFNGIGDLMPGEGYLVKMAADDELIYPATDAVAAGSSTQAAGTSSKSQRGVHWPAVQGDPSDIIWKTFVFDATLNGVSLEANDELAVYDGDLLVGSVVLPGTPTGGVAPGFDLNAWKTLNSGPGFTPGNEYTFKCWDASEDIESTGFTVTFLAGGTDVFPVGNLTSAGQFVFTAEAEVAPELISAVAGDGAVDLTWSPIPEDATDGVYWPAVQGDPSDIIWKTFVFDATLNGVSLEANDELAVYDGDLLVGSVVLPGTPTGGVAPGFDLNAWKTLNSGPGFTPGNAYTFKCWDASENLESTGFTVTFLAGGTDVFPDGNLTSAGQFVFTAEAPYVPTFNIYVDGGLAVEGVEGNMYTVDELTNGQEYCFEVSQILEDGSESGLSNELCATPEADCEDVVIDNFPADPDDVCEGSEFEIDFNVVEILNAESFEYVVDPAEAGIYDEVDGYFYLDMDYVGPVTITLMAYAAEGCADAEASLSFTVNPLPVADCPVYEPVCLNSDPITFPLVEGGVYYDEAFEMVTGLTPDMVGVYFFTLVVTDANGCVNECNFEIEVLALPDVMLTAFEPVCEGTDEFPLFGGTPEGGMYYVDGEEATMFNPAMAGLYMVEYVYTDIETGCTATADGEILVNPMPALGFCFNGDLAETDETFTICYDEIMTVTLCEVWSGTGPFDIEYSLNGGPAELVEGVMLNDALFDGILEPGNYVVDIVSITDANGCMAEDVTPYTANVVVNQEPDANFCVNGVVAGYGDEFNFCETETVVVDMCEILSGTGPFDVCWTLDAGMVECMTVDEGGILFNDMLAVGTHEIVLTSITDANGCVLADPTLYTMTIVVNALPVLECPEELALNILDLPYTLEGTVTPVGGEYSGDNVVDGIFDVTEVGNYEVTYTYTDVETGCVNFCTFAVIVSDEECQDAVIENFPEFQEDVCEGEMLVISFFDVVVLNAIETEWLVEPEEAGMYAGTDFALADDYVGPVTLTLNAFAAEPCEDASASLTFNVNPLPVAECPEIEPVCAGSDYIMFPEVLGGVYTDMDGMVVDGLDPMMDGTYGFTLTVTTEFGCEDMCMFDVVVNPLPVAECPEIAPVCVGSDYIMFPEVEGGVYTDGDGMVVDGFEPMMAGTFGFTLTVTNEFDCSAFCEFVVVVNPLPSVELEFSAEEICLGEEVTVTITGPEDAALPYEVEFSFNGEVVTQVIEVLPLVLPLVPEEAGMYTLEVMSITDANSCVSVLNDVYELNVLPLTEITMQPMDVSVEYGMPAEFSVEAENATGYQWYFNGEIIEGATGDSYAIESVTLEDAGEYHVVAMGECGDAPSEVAFLDVLPWTQTISFGGAINGMSTYLSLTEDQLGELFAPIIDDVSFVEFKQPDQSWSPLNASFAFEEEKGAKVVLSGGVPTSIDVQGYPTLPLDVTLPDGNNFMPVWSHNTILADDLFTPIIDDISAVYSMDFSGFWWPEYNFYTLEYIVPGSSYLIVLKNAATLNFDVPTVDANPGYAGVPRNITNWSDVTLTATQHHIAITSNALSQLQNGDVIGAFNQFGQITGMVEVTDTRENTVMKTFGDNPLTERTEGFEVGDMMTIKVWRNGEEMIAQATFDENLPNANIFAEDGMSAITNLKVGATSINDLTADLEANLYPNPATELVNIETNFEISNIKVVNYVGQIVFNQNVNQENFQINTSDYRSGMYFVQIENNDGVVITKRLTIK